MARINLTTFQDLVEHLLDWCGASPTAEARRDARRAALSGYRELADAHRWSCYFTRGRISTVAPYQTGTITYTHTGGLYSRLLTLTGGTWPDWAALGTVVIANVPYEVSTRVSDTLLTLTASSNPGADVASGTSYTLYRDTFPLPADCLALDQLQLMGYVFELSGEHPGMWLHRQRIWRGQATPRTYCIRGDPNYMGTLAISFFPPPDQAYQVDFVYQRRPRDLLTEVYQTGTATSAASFATITGTGTAWASKHIGSVLRLSPTAADLPTGRHGSNPAAYERVVVSVESATGLTLDQVVPATLTGVKYTLSDPADIEEAAMLTALMRASEWQMAMFRNKSEVDRARAAYEQALIRAREADSRSFAPQDVSGQARYPYRLRDFPLGADQG